MMHTIFKYGTVYLKLPPFKVEFIAWNDVMCEKIHKWMTDIFHKHEHLAHFGLNLL